MTRAQTGSGRREVGGYSLVEAMVVVAIIGAIAAMASPRFVDWFENQRVRSAARSAADLFLLARSEAIRTQRNHVVFFGPPGTTDPAGTALLDSDGSPAPMLLLDDGPPATANCRIDGGEQTETILAEPGVSWGVSFATAKVASDAGAANHATGSTFADLANNPINWVLFRPDGIPVVFDASGGDCGVVGDTGSAGAGLYVTNGGRDYAIVLSSLGSPRLHAWRNGGSAWSD